MAICEKIFNIGFLLDSSNDLGKNFAKMKYFINAMALSHNVHEGMSRGGVISFSSDANIDITLSSHADTIAFIKTVNRLQLHGEGRRLDRALQKAQEMFQDKNNYSNILIILTAGSQPPSKEEIDLAKSLRQDGVRIFTISVSRKTDDEMLSLLAEDESERISSVKYFDDLIKREFISQMIDSVCNAGNSVNNNYDINL